MSTEVSQCQEPVEYYLENISDYVIFTISIIGATFNVLNILVFTKTPKITTPNFIFTHLSFVDFMALLAYISKCGLHLLRYDKIFYGWALCSLFIDILIATLLFTSTLLTMMSAAWKYFAVVYPLTERRWCSMKITRNAVIAGYIVSCALLPITTYLSREIITINKNQTSIYEIKIEHNLRSSTFVAIKLMGRILLLVALSVCTFGLIRTLLARRTKHEGTTSSSNFQNGGRKLKMKQKIDRSILILLIVLVLFTIAEFPMGLLCLQTLIYNSTGHQFLYNRCLLCLTKVYPTIVVINISITFILYYTLSEQFRSTFRSLFNNTRTSHQYQQHTSAALFT